jgi:lipopolysaccharide transport system permease protein
VLALLSPAAVVGSIRESASLLSRHRRLTLELTKREVTERHAGQVLGAFWAVGQPLLLLATYVVVFDVVFRIRLTSVVGGIQGDYTVYILAGLVAWLPFQQAMNAACSAVTREASLVKQVVFQLEILPVKTTLASAIPLALGTAFLVVYVAVSYRGLPATYALVPLLVAIELVAMIGLAFLLSALTVYFRDIREIVQLYSVIGVYLIPAFYPPGAVPAAFRALLYFNPFSYMVWCWQDATFYGSIEHPYAWVVFGVGSLLAYAFGYRAFRRLKPTFGNVL